MRKENKRYYFTVEGETEQWYFEWLAQEIRKESSAFHTVSFDVKKQKDPLARAKRLSPLGKIKITHVVDMESNEPMHTEQFRKTLVRMKEAEKLGKDVKYLLGYSNFSFELWIVLHKLDLKTSLLDRTKYLAPINRAFDEKFLELSGYKREKNFKRVLSKLDLGDVKRAIARAKAIMQDNRESGHVSEYYKGYEFCRNNPALSVWESVEQIMTDCGLL
jgi:hypothetical protein